MSTTGGEPRSTELRAEAQRELDKARKWLADGDVGHGAVHVAQAIAADPSLPEAYLEADRIYVAARRSEAPFLGANQGHIGNVAARAHLAAGAGELGKAFQLLVAVIVHEPAKPWTDTAWWVAAGSSDDPVAVGRALTRTVPQFENAPDPAALRPFVDLTRRLVDVRPDDIELAVAMSGVAIALGAPTDAAAWCERAEKLTPGALGPMMLGYALRAAGRYDEMEAAWERAIAADPANLDVQVDLAKVLISQDRRVDAELRLQRVLAEDPAHSVARALRFAVRFRDNWDIVHLAALVDEARSGEHEDAALEMLRWASEERIWLNRVPMPTEAITAMARQVSRMRVKGEPITVNGPVIGDTIEPPSAVAAALRVMPDTTLEPLVGSGPDIRVPLAEVTYQVWRYDGVTAVPAVGKPSPVAAELLREVANLPWAHPLAAYAQSARFADTSVDDLLGLLCHIPPPPDNERWNQLHPQNPSYWPRLAAAWASVAILHHRADQPWASSIRRQVLLDLANGVEDWTTDSALFALTVAGWIDPEVRSEVRGTVRERLDAARAARATRPVEIAASLAELMLVTPGALPGDQKVAAAFKAATAKKPPKTGLRKLFGR